jgi:hypothetical protein
MHRQRTKKYVTCSKFTQTKAFRRKQSVNVNTSDIEVSPVNLSQPSLNNSIVDLSWERYQDIISHIMKLKFETIPLVLEEDTKSSNWQ